MQTLPERPQRGHWEFLFKNKDPYQNVTVHHIDTSTVLSRPLYLLSWLNNSAALLRQALNGFPDLLQMGRQRLP